MILLGITGHIKRPVLFEGWLYVIISFGLLTGIVYGTMSGTFYDLRNIIEGLCYGIVLFAPCFPALFAASQLVSFAIHSQILSSFSGTGIYIGAQILILYDPFIFKALQVLIKQGRKIDD